MRLSEIKTLDELKKFIHNKAGRHYQVEPFYPYQITVLMFPDAFVVWFDKDGRIMYGTKSLDDFRDKPLFDNRKQAEQFQHEKRIEYLEKVLKLEKERVIGVNTDNAQENNLENGDEV